MSPVKKACACRTVRIYRKRIKLYFQKAKDRYNFTKLSHTTTVVVIIITFSLLGLAFTSLGTQRLGQIINSGYDTSSTAQYYGVLGAHIVDITRFIDEETTHLSVNQKNTVADWAKNNHSAQTTDAMTGLAKGKNVIMIQVE